MHSLIERQIKKFLGAESRIPENLQAFLSAINEAYTQNDFDRAMLERSLELSSAEMRESYNKLQALHGELERRIQERTAELVDANRFLQAEIAERKQMEIMQEAVYRIAQAAEEIEALNSLYPKIHQIISDVMSVENFYIALYDRDRDELTFSYYVDEVDSAPPGKIQPGRGMSAYVLRTGKSLLCTQAVYEKLERQGEVELLGPPSPIWLGVPLIIHNNTIGVMAVQHYSNPNAYDEAEKHILEFVSSQVARAIERKRIEEELRLRETRYSALIENSVDSVSLVSADGRLIYENSTAVRPLGYPEGTHVGRNLIELVHPDDLSHAQQLLSEVLGQPDARRHWELRLRHMDGSWRWLEGTASNMLEEPSVQALVLNYRDVTERKQIRAALDRKNRILSALNDTTPILMGRLKLNEVLATIVVQAARMMDSLDGYLYLVESDESALRVEVGTGVFEQYQGYQLKRGEGLAGKVWETGQPLLVEDYQSWKGRSEHFDHLDFHQVVAVPLISASRVIGVIGVSQQNAERIINEEDVELLSRFAEYAAIALENARLHRLVQLELIARTEAEESARQFRILLDQSNDAIYVIDAETAGYVDFNTNAYESLGYTRDELRRLRVLDIATHVPDEKTWKKRVELISSKKEGLTFEAFYRRKDGTNVPVEISARMIQYGTQVYMLAVVRDMTERKQAEATLRQITDNMQDVITHIGPDGIIRYASPSHKWVLGLDAEEMIGHPILDRLHPDDMAEALAILSRAIFSREKPDLITLRYQHAEGHYLWMECVGSILLDSQGEFAGAVLSSRDVTRRKEMETALRESELRYRLLADHASDVIWVRDMTLRLTYISPAVERLRGFTVGEALSQHTSEILTPDSAIYAQQFFADSLSQASTLSGNHLKDEYRTLELEMRKKDGSTVWTETLVSFLLDDQGKPIGILGVTRDISERQKAAQQLRQLNAELEERVKERTGELVAEIAERRRIESALRESEERYTLAVQGANDGLWDWNLLTGEIYFSPRWKSMMGYPEDATECGLDHWFTRIHPDYYAHVQKAVQEHIHGDSTHFEVEYLVRLINGEERWVLCRGLAVRDGEGRAYRMAGSQTDITDRKIAEERLAHDALHDSLTGLPNRTLFSDRLQQRLEYSRRHKDSLFAVLFLDMDRFKVINDSLGHAIGDQFLITTAERLQACLRPEDTISRFGGDEFAILLSEITEVSDAIRVADRIQARMKGSTLIGPVSRSSTASIGITIFNGNYTDPQEMLRDADSAMYRAKAQGGGRYQLFDVEIYNKAMALLRLESDLKRAVENEEWLICYQPVILSSTRTVIGFEALVRWRHPERGLVLPGEFISLAEESGLIIPIGEYVLYTACRQAKDWRDNGHPELWVSVNLSARQFQDQYLVQKVLQILHDTGLPGGGLRLEVTETVAMKDFEHSVKVLQELNDLGIHLSLDDFGNGYSSLGYLKGFPIRSLKIDRSFIRDIDLNRNSEAITSAIISLGHNLNLDVVAEGVETDRQLDFLVAQSCDEIQGFLFGRPLPASEACQILAH